MESKIKWRKWEEKPEYGDYLVAIRQKYEWEDEWEEFIEPASYEFSDDFTYSQWKFKNDWNEGQEYEFAAMVNINDIPFPLGDSE